jgi:hypothetical protein
MYIGHRNDQNQQQRTDRVSNKKSTPKNPNGDQGIHALFLCI